MARNWTYLLTKRRFEIYSNGECVCFMSARVGKSPRESATFYLRGLYVFMSSMLQTAISIDDLLSLTSLSSNAVLKLTKQIEKNEVSL